MSEIGHGGVELALPASGHSPEKFVVIGDGRFSLTQDLPVVVRFGATQTTDLRTAVLVIHVETSEQHNRNFVRQRAIAK